VTKTLTLEDDAYDALESVRHPNESFSDLARRLARLAAQADLFARRNEPPVFSDGEAEALKRSIYRARDESR
jgi:predicted CopG family antitoxin